MRWPGFSKRPSFFDIDMDHVPRVFALVANNGLGWFEVLDTAQASPAEHPADGCWRDLGFTGDLLACEAELPEGDDLLAGLVWCWFTQPARPG
jgi:hypothetical protein